MVGRTRNNMRLAIQYVEVGFSRTVVHGPIETHLDGITCGSQKILGEDVDFDRRRRLSGVHGKLTLSREERS
jgi:hypothetical protein